MTTSDTQALLCSFLVRTQASVGGSRQAVGRNGPPAGLAANGNDAAYSLPCLDDLGQRVL